MTSALHMFAVCGCCFLMTILLTGCNLKDSLKDNPIDDCEADENCEEALKGDVAPSESRKWSVLGDVGICESLENLNSTAMREWIIQLPDDWSTAKLRQYGQGSPGEVLWRGKPSEKGTSAIIYRGDKAMLEQCLADHPGALFAEETINVTFNAAASGLRLNKSKQRFERRLAQHNVNSSLWGLDRLDSQVGLDQIYDNFGNDGSNVHVYVLDTGIRISHDEFEGRAIPELDVTVFPQEECNGNANCAADRNGHGTHCAGTIAGRTVGVAKQAIVHAMKVLGDNGSGSNRGIIQAIDFVTTQGQRPAVISMSLGCGSPCQSRSEAIAIQAAVRAGVTVVVAAGNNGNTNRPDACDYAPANIPQAITVGSITINNDQRSSFSNIGSCIDVFAPGSFIFSASHRSNTGGTTLSGTSMACPHVSGVAALALGRNPSLDPFQVTDLIINTAVTGRVRDARGSPNRLLNIERLADADPSPNPSPTPSPVPNPSPTPSPTPIPGFNKIGDGFCRTASGSIGTFALIAVSNFEQCAAACSDQPTCVAIEFHTNLRCELHTEEITQLVTSENSECFVKVTSTSELVSTTTASFESTPSVTASPSPIRFVAEISAGSCLDVGGVAINDQELCQRAARVLGVPDITASQTNAVRRPEGCYVFRGRFLFMGVNPASEGNGAETSTRGRSRHPICGFRA